jgi:hypothetical protein
MSQQIKINDIEILNIENSNVNTFIPIATSNIVFGNFDSNFILDSFTLSDNFSNISNKISVTSFSYSNLADNVSSGILQYVPSDNKLTGEWKIVDNDITSKKDFVYELSLDSSAFYLDIDTIFNNTSNGFQGFVCMSLKGTEKYCFATVFKNILNDEEQIQTNIIHSSASSWVLTDSDDNNKLKIAVDYGSVTTLYVNIR